MLQSANLRHKEVGYVNKEINLALDRQQYYRPPARFLIPAILDDRDNQLRRAAELQCVDLTAPDGIDESRQGDPRATSTWRAGRDDRPGRLVGAGRGPTTPPPPPATPAGGRSRRGEVHRYPGSPPFGDSELDRLLFRGRAREIDEVLHSILSYDLLLVYAVSGMGKTSLLTAGVLEPLRERGYFPVIVRAQQPRPPVASS